MALRILQVAAALVTERSMAARHVQRDTPDRSYMQPSALARFEGAAHKASSACHYAECIVLSSAFLKMQANPICTIELQLARHLAACAALACLYK